ncbi:MAG: phosphoglucosamine mutase [Clostridia bacterium]|nr:phosphoglucosamine mutase [Clostridia bacterium]
MGKYFGTDGFRGEANEGLTAEHAFKIGRFLGWYFTEKRRKFDSGRARIAIGKDTRRSGYMFEYALVGGLVASGADAYLLHVTTTPSVAYVVRAEGFDCGIMISASHNPYYDNGIKLFNGAGEKMDEEVIRLVEGYLDGEDVGFGAGAQPPYAKREYIGRSVDYVAGRNRYVGYLISLGMYSFKGIKIGLDCANGSAWTIAKAVFDALGATTVLIGGQPDGTNINQGCGSTHIEKLQALVKAQGLHVGFAYDGDADRCLCVDENGEIVDGDKIIYLCAKYLKDRRELLKNTVVTTVMSNFGLYKALERLGVSYKKTAVGDKYVYEKMTQEGYVLGGEQSGHIIFSKYASTGDGVLTSLMVMQAMLDTKKSLSALALPMEVYPQVLKNVRVADKRRAVKDEEVQAAVEKADKRLAGKGRVLLRESGTEPVVRVMVEAEDTALCKECVEEILAVIEKKGYAVKSE